MAKPTDSCFRFSESRDPQEEAFCRDGAREGPWRPFSPHAFRSYRSTEQERRGG